MVLAANEFAAGRIGKELVGKPERAQGRQLGHRRAGPGELGRKESEVEADVMTDHDRARQSLSDVAGDLLERRRVEHVRRGNAVDVRRPDVPTRVDEGLEFVVHGAVRVQPDDGDLDDSIVPAVAEPSRFDIDDRERSLTPRAATSCGGHIASGAATEAALLETERGSLSQSGHPCHSVA
jgi:hypothetical protein